MRYQFGCNLNQFLFEQISGNTLKSAVAERVIAQMTTWLPYVIVDKLNVIDSTEDSSLDPNQLEIRMSFRLSGRPETTAEFALRTGLI